MSAARSRKAAPGSRSPRDEGPDPQRAGRGRGRPVSSGGESVGAEAIVRKVCELLRDREPREVKLQLVARSMGVDRSLIRYYFKNRDTLILAVARHLFDRMRDSMRAFRLIRGGSPESEIRETARALLRFKLEHPYFGRMMAEEIARSRDPAAKAFFRSFVGIGLKFYRRVARDMRKSGNFKPYDGVFLYIAVIGACDLFATGTPYLKQAFGEDYNSARINRRYEEFLCEFVIGGIRSYNGPPRRSTRRAARVT